MTDKFARSSEKSTVDQVNLALVHTTNNCWSRCFGVLQCPHFGKSKVNQPTETKGSLTANATWTKLNDSGLGIVHGYQDEVQRKTKTPSGTKVCLLKLSHC